MWTIWTCAAFMNTVAQCVIQIIKVMQTTYSLFLPCTLCTNVKYHLSWTNPYLLIYLFYFYFLRPLWTNWWRRWVSQSHTLWSAYDQMLKRCVSPCECFCINFTHTVQYIIYRLYTFLCLLFDINPCCFSAPSAF